MIAMQHDTYLLELLLSTADMLSLSETTVADGVGSTVILTAP